MRLSLILVFLISTLSAKPHSVAQIKKEYYRIQKMVKNGKLVVKKRDWDNGNIMESIKMYLDDKGVVRFLILEGGSGDSFHKGEYSYDENGELFFSYVRDANMGGCEVEIRNYYSGKKVLNRKKKVNKCEIQRVYPLRLDNPKKALGGIGN